MLAVPILLIGIGAGLWFTGILPGLLGMKHEEKAEHEAPKPPTIAFVDLPDMIANMSGPGAKPSYIKLQVRLEITKAEDAEKVKQAMPRLQDMFQTYLQGNAARRTARFRRRIPVARGVAGPRQCRPRAGTDQ